MNQSKLNKFINKKKNALETNIWWNGRRYLILVMNNSKCLDKTNENSEYYSKLAWRKKREKFNEFSRGN